MCKPLELCRENVNKGSSKATDGPYIRFLLMDSNALDLALDKPIYFNREASSGDQEFSGGGCGCN